MSHRINLPVILEAGDDRVEITDAACAEIVRLGADDKLRNIAGLVESTAALLLRVKAMEGSQDDAAALRSKLDSIQSALGVPTQHVGDERVDEVYAIEQIRAKLADAERRADEMEGKAGEWIAAHVHKERMCIIRAERDKALADLAAARESEDRFRGEVVAAFRKHGLAAGPEAIAGLVRDLAATKAQLAKSERGNLDASQAIADTLVALGAGDHEGPRLAALRVKQERDAARASLEESRAAGWRLADMRDNAEKERDELRASLNEAKADAERSKAEFNKEHVHTLRANKLLFEAMSVMRRWGNLCHGEYQSLDARIDEHLSRKLPIAKDDRAAASAAPRQSPCWADSENMKQNQDGSYSKANPL